MDRSSHRRSRSASSPTGSWLGAFWKYRVGDSRIIASIEDAAIRILIVRIGNRKQVYRE